MKVAGVIAEYNPFHNGHQYQLAQLRKQTGADYIIVAMSGSFLQRGVPAIVDKYTRTKMALENGADLVIELPVLWSTSSAEYFAHAGVGLLCKTGVVEAIGYGVEQKQPKLISALVTLLNDSPDAYGQGLSRYQREGLSFPLARAAVLSELLPQYSAEQLQAFLNQPNNILSLEYEKALAKWNTLTGCTIAGLPIERIGDGYHDKNVNSAYASATAIRNLLEAQPEMIPEQKLMPLSASAALLDACSQGLTLSADDFSSALYYKLLSEQEKGYERYADCTPDLSRKIVNHISDYTGFCNFCSLLKSKDLTYTRISRVLLHILLRITKEDYSLGASLSYIPYLRALGFKKDAAPLLTEIKKNASVPLITKVADAKKRIPENAYPLFALDLYAANLYRGIACTHSGYALPNEFTTEIILAD